MKVRVLEERNSKTRFFYEILMEKLVLNHFGMAHTHNLSTQPPLCVLGLSTNINPEYIPGRGGRGGGGEVGNTFGFGERALGVSTIYY